jgi:hypothetical protein
MEIMIEKPRVSTIDKPARFGGLLIFGLNYGLRKGGIPQGEIEFKPWAEYEGVKSAFDLWERGKGDALKFYSFKQVNVWKIHLYMSNALTCSGSATCRA